MGRQEVEYAKKLREASDKMLADRAEAEAKEKPKPMTLEVEAKVRPDGNRPLAEGAEATLELRKLKVTVASFDDEKTVELEADNNEPIGFGANQIDDLMKALKAKSGYVETLDGDVLKVAPSEDKKDAMITGGNVYLMLLAPELDKILKFLTTQLKESTNEDGSEQNAVAEGQEETPAEGSEEASPEAGEVTGEAKKKAPPFQKKDGDDKDKDDKDAKKKDKDKGGDKDKTKKCKACGEEIPADIEAGAKCPECGEIWDKKKEGPPKKDKKEDLELVRTRIRDRIKKVRAAYEAGERRRAAPDSSRRVEGDEREKAREERLERLAQRYPELVSRIRARREAKGRRQDPRVAESDEIGRQVISDIRRFGGQHPKV